MLQCVLTKIYDKINRIIILVKIKVRSRIEAPKELVWEIISDLENDAYFWKGITSTTNISRNGNSLTREVILGKDNVCLQVLHLYPTKRVQTKWVSGVISGTREILLFTLDNATLVEVQMNYDFSGIGRQDSKKLTELFQREAELAVELIKRRSERIECDISMTRKVWMNQ